ncbi:MAG: hypothetical protein BWK80_48715 [Desulfobacteraceae bacterium IS3]|nr:MAG: hypothetical protein BWK80_48715 [Desulfobacteraceae bacterium IS3]
MQIHDRIFSDKYLETKAAGVDVLQVKDIEKKLEIVKDWQAGISSKRILNAKEEELQSAFLYRFFGDILGYVYAKGAKHWHLDVEQKTLADSSRMDGALGFFSLDENGKTLSDIRVVMELKNARSDLDKPQNRKNDRRTPVQQAFDYAHSVGGTCKWVIVSNFVEIRFYCQNDRSRYESFDIRSLDKTDAFRRFLFLLQKDRLLSQSGESFTDKLYRERQEQEEKISKAFYNDYKDARIKLFYHLREQNSGIDEFIMLNKTQKILDRVLFVCFCEDLNILPPYTFRNLLKSVKADKFNRDETKIYARVRGLFDAINSGYPEENINRFNGGLFAADEVLDKLLIKDDVFEQVIGLERYDFASDLNVNILGHIFEQSVSDIEELRAGIAGESFDRRQGKRKKEGIFYTPEYITRYIVEQAVGGWLADRKAEIGFDSLPELTEADYAASKIVRSKLKTNENVKKHIQASEAYRDRLANIRVLDPACGSGAFLNQVFDYLYKEGQKVNDELARLKAGQREIYDLDKAILTGNIFGVDLNPESVEITKLSLWLKTANRNKELTTLDSNIKCGNSLIDDAAVAGDRAFDWYMEFPEIMADGGFDVVIGNPPYLNMTRNNYDNKWLDFYISEFESIKKANSKNIFTLFIEKGILLLRENSVLSFIVPEGLFKTRSYADCVYFMSQNGATKAVAYFEDRVFEDAVTGSIIFIFEKSKNKQTKVREFLFTKSKEYLPLENPVNPIIQQIESNGKPLKEIAMLFKGMVVKDRKDFLFKTEDSEHPDKFLLGNCIARYKIHDIFYSDYNKLNIVGGTKSKEKHDIAPKILIRRTGNTLCCTILEDKSLTESTLYSCYPNDDKFNIYYILAILNSSLHSYFIKNKMVTNKQAFPQILMTDLQELKIPDISLESQKNFIKNVTLMLSQNKILHEIKSDFLNFLQSELKPVKISKHLEKWQESDLDGFKKELAKGGVKMSELSLKARKEWQDYFVERKAQAQKIKALIDETDKEIDRMVYSLYGLTEAEIRIVNQDCR